MLTRVEASVRRGRYTSRTSSCAIEAVRTQKEKEDRYPHLEEILKRKLRIIADR